MKKEVFKRYKREILLSFLLFLGSSVTLGIDIFYIPNIQFSTDIVNVLFSTIMTLAGLWFAFYLLLVQLYKDRVPFKTIKSKIEPNTRIVIIIMLYSALMGSFVMFTNYKIISSIYFSIVEISAIIITILTIYSAHKTLLSTSHIDEFFEVLKKEINNNGRIINTTTINKIMTLFDENIVKEEYYTAKIIIEKTGNIFIEFLKKGLEDKSPQEKENFEKSFDEIIRLNMLQIEECEKIKSDLLVGTIYNQQYKNISFCINNGLFDRYKKYIKEFGQLLFEEHKKSGNENISMFYMVLLRTFDLLIEEGDKIEWIEFTLSLLSFQNNLLVFENENINKSNYSKLLTYLMMNNTGKSDVYSIVFSKIKEFTKVVSGIQGAFNDIKIYYSVLFETLLEKDYDKALEFFKIILPYRTTCVEDKDLISFKYHCEKALMKKHGFSLDGKRQILEYQFKTNKEAIKLNKESESYILLPELKELFSEIKTTDDIRFFGENLTLLLNECIVRDNVQDFYIVLYEIQEAAGNIKRDKKKLQIEVFEIYYWLFDCTVNLINKQFFEIAFKSFRKLIDDLDRAEGFSEDLLDNMIGHLADIARKGVQENTTLATNIIDLFRHFLEEGKRYNFASRSEDRRKIHRAVFNIGTDCIEWNYDNGVRDVSNTLGWYIINSLKQGTGEATEYLLDRAFELYSLSQEMQISKKTLMFVLTLFTTVGTFCCKDKKYHRYLNKIVRGLKTTEEGRLDNIRIAVSLRTSENDMWNDLFDNKTKELSKEFLKKVKDEFSK